jgi:bacillithiol system protein YtxJ
VINECKNERDLEALIEKSKEKPQLLLKHSTRCGLSKMAMAEFRRLAASNGDAGLSVVLVVETRPLAAIIADQTGIPHESPQVMLFCDGKVVWHASHNDVNLGNMKEAVEKVAK